MAESATPLQDWLLLRAEADRGWQASAEPGLLRLEGPQLVALVAILKRLAVPESETLMELTPLAASAPASRP